MKKKKDFDGILKEAVERLELANEAEDDNIKRAKEALAFRDLDQWPEKIRQARENDPEGARPCLVVDKINQYVNQVKNDQRQNRPAIKIRPVDDKGDPKVAEIIQGLIRNIEQQSRASVAYDTAHEGAVDGGYGYFRVITDYVDDESFDQEPKILRIRNRFSVRLDPSRQMPDGSDARWGFVFENLTREEFKSQYPKAKEVSFEDYAETAPDWVDKDGLIVAEYFRIVTETKEIARLADGSVVPAEDAPADAPRRKVKKKTVEWRKMTCAEELDFRVIPGEFIPIVEVVGNELDINGKRKLSGLIRGAMDAQRMYNYASSSFAEIVGGAPKTPWVAAEGQIEGYENDWRTANRRNLAVLTYRPVLEGGVMVPPPQRASMPGIPAGWQQEMLNREHDIQTAMGMYASNLGEQTQAKSGIQEAALQRRGDTATFHYTDNLSLSIQHCGRILVGMIPALYDTARVVRILGEDGEEDYIRIDPEQKEPVKTIIGADGKKITYYNLNVGKYDVAVTVGPAFTTKRQEAAQWLTQMVSAKPELMSIIGDLMFRAMDVPYADEAAERMKKMLPPQLQEPIDESELPPEVADAIQRAQAMIEQQKQGIAMAVQELDKMQQEAGQETAKAKQAKADLEKAAMEIRHEQEVLRLSEDLVNARLQAKTAKQDADIRDALTTVREIIGEHEATMKTFGDNQSADAMMQILGQHEIAMRHIYDVLSNLTANSHNFAANPSVIQ